MPKILVVDQDLYALERYKELFSKAGFDTHIAEDATSALSKFGEVKPDLVVLDEELPGGGGRMVLESLRNNFMSKVPVLFIAADTGTISDFLDAPGVYIAKEDFLTQALPLAIKKILNI